MRVSLDPLEETRKTGLEHSQTVNRWLSLTSLTPPTTQKQAPWLNKSLQWPAKTGIDDYQKCITTHIIVMVRQHSPHFCLLMSGNPTFSRVTSLACRSLLVHASIERWPSLLLFLSVNTSKWLGKGAISLVTTQASREGRHYWTALVPPRVYLTPLATPNPRLGCEHLTSSV
jgi:hypothetical protein